MKDVPDYTFTNQRLRFHPTAVCLEEPFYVQLFFLKTLYDQLLINGMLIYEALQRNFNPNYTPPKPDTGPYVDPD